MDVIAQIRRVLQNLAYLKNGNTFLGEFPQSIVVRVWASVASRISSGPYVQPPTK